MPVFLYRGIKKDGTVIKGIIEASAESTALQKLKASGIYPIKIQLSTEKKRVYIPKIFKGFSNRELSLHLRTLGILLDSGISLTDAIRSIIDGMRDGKLKIIFSKVLDKVKAGNSLSKSFEESGIEDKLVLSIIDVGEKSGVLSGSLLRISDILEKRERVKSNLLGILLYPMVILIVSFAVIAFMISVVVPKIVKIYLTMKVQLPLSTRAVIWLSSSFIDHKVFFAVLLIVIFLLMYVLRAKYKNVYDLIKVKLPIFGTVFLNSSLQRFFETLFILLHSGIPLVRALDIAKATLDNKYLEVIVSDIKDKVEKGSSLYDSIRNSGKEIFPNISLQLIKAGENSGNLEQSLQKLSDIFEEEIENFSKYLTSILEPITIILVGTVIGFIVFSLLLPIAQISTLR